LSFFLSFNFGDRTSFSIFYATNVLNPKSNLKGFFLSDGGLPDSPDGDRTDAGPGCV